VRDGLAERQPTGVRLVHEQRRMRNASVARIFEDWPEQEWEQFPEFFERFVQDYERTIPVLVAESGLGPRSGGEK
jgi:hypothetical protein